MEKAILGTKIGMTQLFAENGTVVPVTAVSYTHLDVYKRQIYTVKDQQSMRLHL